PKEPAVDSPSVSASRRHWTSTGSPDDAQHGSQGEGRSMRIVEASLHRVALPLVHRFQTSSHAKSSLEHILVRLVDESGQDGWGEIASPSGPFYSPATVDTCWLIARDHVLPGLIGSRWEHPRDAAATWQKVRGHYFTKAGVDMAA